MLNKPLIVFLAANIALCSAAYAQRTWIVDPRGAPHGDFADFPPAVAAAQPGDTIILNLNVGQYTTTTIDKGITVMQERGPCGSNSNLDLHVANVPAGQTFSAVSWNGDFTFDFQDCAGNIQLTDFGASGALDRLMAPVDRIVNCAFVSMFRSGARELEIENSRVLIASATFVGRLLDPATLRRSSGLTLRNSDVILARPTVFITSPFGGGPADIPGIVMDGGRLVVSGQGVIHGATSCCPFQTSPAIHSDGGEVIIDPDIGLNVSGGTTLRGTSTFRFEERPALYMPLIHLSTVLGTPGASAFVLASLPAPPVQTPFGEFWLDLTPGHAVLLASGTIDANGEFHFPNRWFDTMTAGQRTTWQGVVVDGNGIQLTTPVIASNPRRCP